MIASNKVKDKIASGMASCGGWVMTGSPVCAEILAQSGFDWVCVDAEHSSVTMETAQHIFTGIERHGAEPFVRIADNDEIECKKFLDMGARGIIVPMIKSYEDVLNTISYTKFPPRGNRSFALPRATGYGAYSEAYFRAANDSLFLAIMIEHVDALDDLDSIFACDEVDAVLVGPYDLSGSLGIPGRVEDARFRQALDFVLDKARRHGVAMGIHDVHPTRRSIAGYIEAGYRFIGCGIDTLFISGACEALLGKQD